MADLTSARPTEAEKAGEYLHTRDKLPEAPGRGTKDFIRQNSLIINAIVFAAIFTALAFTARDGWATRRDFVTAVPVPLWSLAGVALALFAVRMKWGAATIPLGLIFVSMLFTGFMFLNNEYVEGNHADARKILGAIAGATLLIGTNLLIANAVKSEVTDPTKPPPPTA